MKQSITRGLLLLAASWMACSVMAAPEIAILHGRVNHQTDFDGAVRKLGYEVDYYKCNTEAIKDFSAKVLRYKLVMVDSLFNYGPDGKWLISEDATDYGAIREFIKQGGVLVVADTCYPQVRNWMKRIDSDFSLPAIGKCNSSQWAVLGHTVNVEPIDPIRSFPNRITQGNSWPHYEKAIPRGWKVLSNCSEGYPVTLSRPYGKGLVVASALRQPTDKLLENYFAAAQLLRAGVTVKSMSMTPFVLGEGNLQMELVKAAEKDTKLIYELTDSKGKVTTFATNFVGTTAQLNFNITTRGLVTTRLYIESPSSGRGLLFTRREDLPPLLKIDPPAYRGILSTKRRTPDVKFRVRFAPLKEDLRGSKLTLEFYDSLSNMVYSTEQVFVGDDQKTKVQPPMDFDYSVPLPKGLSAGGYEVRAKLNRYNARSEAAFEILAPRTAQTVIDEDKTFLVNGKPFFPLGIYHPANDYTKIADVGFNMIQFWKWDLAEDKYGTPMGLNKSIANGLRCLLESNHHGEHIYRETAQRYGTHDAMLMWYVADEPAEGAEETIHMINNTWHKHDKHHPTYLLSCREDLFGHHATMGDVFAFDAYGDPKKGFNSAIPQIASWMDIATKATRNRKAVIVVPWSYIHEKDRLHLHRTIAYTAIANDARGIIWYPWKQAGGGPLGIGLVNEEENQKVLKEVLTEVKGTFPGILSTKRRCFRPMDGKLNCMVCGTERNNRFLIMVNPTAEKIEAEFEVEELAKIKEVKIYPSKEAVKIDKGKITHTFEPNGVLIYRY